MLTFSITSRPSFEAIATCQQHILRVKDKFKGFQFYVTVTLNRVSHHPYLPDFLITTQWQLVYLPKKCSSPPKLIKLDRE